MPILSFDRDDDALPAVLHPDSFVSPGRGLAYLAVPKTMSRALLAYLGELDPTGALIADGGKRRLAALSATNDLVRFSFVRNPYSRVVSTYLDKFVNYADTGPQREIFARHPGLRPDMSFGELVDWIGSDAGADRATDPHLLPQYYFLFDPTGAPAVDLVGRMEDAVDDLADLQRRAGLPVGPIARVNDNARHTRNPFDTSTRWRELLDDRTIRILTNRYDGDFVLFGYERLPYRVVPLFTRGDPAAVATPRPGIVRRVYRAARRLAVRVTGRRGRRR